MIRVASVTLCLLVHGCTAGSGGAVELSWKFRPASGPQIDKFVDCQPDPADPDRVEGWGPVTQIQLHWQVAGSEGSSVWDCGRNHGATGFDLAKGTAQLWVTPECGDGPAALNTYIAPAILQREVTRGETVSLGAVELVIAVTGCATAGANSPNLGTQACICAPTN